MNKNIVIGVVLGVLVVIAVMQAFQLTGIKNKIAGGAAPAVSAAAPAQTAPAATAPQVPSSLQNLPQMVGGC